MTQNEIRKRYLDFFQKKEHKTIPSTSLKPENDPTTLFTGSGMQPLLPYLLGREHPDGKRLVDSQKCFRAEDIDEVGDNRHTTFFEMLGNWSLGDYFKEEQLSWFFQFLTEELSLDPSRLFVTVFAGDDEHEIPRDTESAEIWKRLYKEKGIEAKDVFVGTEEDGYAKGLRGGRIFYYNAKKNWWSRSGTPNNMPIGEPGGPDSEVFYDFNTSHNTSFGEHCHPNCECGRFLEIGNSVFMEYIKTDTKFERLPQKNVDFGGGLERLVMISQNVSDIFAANHKEIIDSLEKLSGKKYSTDALVVTKAFRIIADHVKASVFILYEGITPSNTEQGYVVRRLLRRAVRYADILGVPDGKLSELVSSVVLQYGGVYDMRDKKEEIQNIILDEEEKFRKTLAKGLREFEKLALDGDISGEDAFTLFSSYGFPIEMTTDIAIERNVGIDVDGFNAEFAKHKTLSRAGAKGKFKGGLADHSEAVVKYHTATHLLHQALFDVLGDGVSQKGSNITGERLRFDFTHPQKMTLEEVKKVEDIVNEKIRANLQVSSVSLPLEEAKKIGARHFFDEKYPDFVSVYFVGDTLDSAYSKEFCGGPHVDRTGMLGEFKIQKEEAVSAGVRRIKAVLLSNS
jgi:alanyl-tRNA synthetase